MSCMRTRVAGTSGTSTGGMHWCKGTTTGMNRAGTGTGGMGTGIDSALTITGVGCV